MAAAPSPRHCILLAQKGSGTIGAGKQAPMKVGVREDEEVMMNMSV